jgi:hypothetical protein
MTEMTNIAVKKKKTFFFFVTPINYIIQKQAFYLREDLEMTPYIKCYFQIKVSVYPKAKKN